MSSQAFDVALLFWRLIINIFFRSIQVRACCSTPPLPCSLTNVSLRSPAVPGVSLDPMKGPSSLWARHITIK